MAGFTGRRLFRALVSLVLFQIILYATIQALPDNTAGMTQAQMLEQVSAGQSQEAASSAEPSGASSAEPAPAAAPAANEEMLANADFFESIGMLDDAYAIRAEAVEDEPAPQPDTNVTTEAAQVEEPVVPPTDNAPSSAAPPEVDAELMKDAAFLEELGLLDDAAMVKEAAVLENPTMLQDAASEVDPSVFGIVGDEALMEEAGLAADGTPLEGFTPDGPVSYEEGLAAIRPPDLTIVQQFIGWLGNFVQGDLGESTAESGVNVTEILANKLPRTLLLFLPSVIIGFLLGLWLGKRAAWQRRKWVDTAGSLGVAAFYTSFPPWLAFLAISVFAVNLRWFPAEKLINPILWLGVELTLNQLIVRVLLTATLIVLAYFVLFRLTRRLWYRAGVRAIGGVVILILAAIPWISSGYAPLALDLFRHVALPMLSLILLSFGETMLIMRTTMQETKESDHIPLARATGIKDSEVRDRHVARIAMLPVLTRFIVYIPFVIIGAFAIAQCFGWDGMGQRLVQAANDNDLPVLMGILSVVGIGILLAHVILDVTTARLDPRLRNLGSVQDNEISSPAEAA
jgi:peptide/nickel transport system permease protein